MTPRIAGEFADVSSDSFRNLEEIMKSWRLDTQLNLSSSKQEASTFLVTTAGRRQRGVEKENRV
jgi:hypothetical protein